MPDLGILAQMINQTAVIPLDEAGKVTLIEPSKPESFVTICGLPEDTIVIKVDEFRSPESIFAGLRGECKRADFIVIANADDDRVIVYIEMKATKGHLNEIIQQLKGAQCFVSYCSQVGKSFWAERRFLDEYRHRFVSIGHTSIPKHPTRYTQPLGVHDCPENLLKIDWPHILQFNRLAGRRHP